MIRHAGLIARLAAGGWRGVLIEGRSGAGKSDLALRALAAGWRLVADDRVLVWRSQARLFGRAPAPLAGLIEARGVGVVPAPARAFAEIALIVRCVDAAEVERCPDPAAEAVLGVMIPVVALAPFEESAPAKIDRALAVLDLCGNRRIKRAAPVDGFAGRGRGPVRFPE